MEKLSTVKYRAELVEFSATRKKKKKKQLRVYFLSEGEKRGLDNLTICRPAFGSRYPFTGISIRSDKPTTWPKKPLFRVVRVKSLFALSNSCTRLNTERLECPVDRFPYSPPFKTHTLLFVCYGAYERIIAKQKTTTAYFFVFCIRLTPPFIVVRYRVSKYLWKKIVETDRKPIRFDGSAGN